MYKRQVLTRAIPRFGASLVLLLAAVATGRAGAPSGCAREVTGAGACSFATAAPSAKPAGPATTPSARPKPTGTKHISGPMETDL